MMKSKYDKLIELLEYHDWFYDYSDDHRAYQWGHDNQIQIEKELDNLGRTKEAMEIYENAMTKYISNRIFIDSGSQHLPMSKPEDRF